MNEKLQESAYCDAVALVGNVLGPFYLKDPGHDAEVEPLFAAIASSDPEEAAAEWPFADSVLAVEALRLMQRAVIDGKPTDDIIWEYRRLFVGPNKMPAPPWGSVYTDREQVIFGAATLDLRQWMREQGIERLGDEKTPEDQIGLMLVLMAWIAQNKPQVLEDYLQHHLLTWSSHFLDELIEAAQQPFYEGLARLTKATLEGLQSDLHLSVEYPRYYR